MIIVIFPLLTFCFPLGILFTPTCQALAVLTGSDGLFTLIETLTEWATGFEAFFESAPQIILQLYIIFKSGIVSTTQLVSIMFSIIMLGKTTVMYDLMGTERTCMTLAFFLLHLPLYAGSGFFRLGGITMSLVFFGYWTIIPIFVLFCILFVAAQSLSFSVVDSAVLALSNLFVVGLS